MYMQAQHSIQTQGLAADWSDDASTLLYDVPSRSGPRGPVTILPPRAQPPVHAGASRLSHHQIVLTTVAATIGAMAAAWSIQQQASAAAPQPHAPAAVAATAPKPPPATANTARAPAAKPTRATPAGAPAKPKAATPAAAAVRMDSAQAARAGAKQAKADPQPPKAAAQPRRTLRARPRPVAARATPKAKPARAEAPRPAAQPAAARTGTLRINSRPWSRVYVDGRFVGNTPQMALALAEGRHRVALVSDEFDLKRTLTVDVKPGRTVTRTVELIQ